MTVASIGSIGDMGQFPLGISESPDSIGVLNCTYPDKSPNIANLQHCLKSLISFSTAAFKQTPQSIGPLGALIYRVHWKDGTVIAAGVEPRRARGVVHWRCAR